jgi:hypothetical protein
MTTPMARTKFPASAIEDSAVLSTAMPALAREVMAELGNDDHRGYLDTLFRLQMLAGDDEHAIESLVALRNLNPNNLSPRPGAALSIYETLARARIEVRRGGSALDAVLGREFRQTVAALDDQTADLVLQGDLLDVKIDISNGLEFISRPLTDPIELSGLFSGRLDFITNKKDFDFKTTLYELTPKGEYFLLATYWSRASHVGDLVNRRLLTPGKRDHLDFQGVRLMSHQLNLGSRIVAVVNVIKSPDQQINYGTGKDVSDESIADAKEQLTIKLFGDSYIVVPVGR